MRWHLSQPFKKESNIGCRDRIRRISGKEIKGELGKDRTSMRHSKIVLLARTWNL